MKAAWALAGLIAMSEGYSALHGQGTPRRSTWDGVYTEEQSKRGFPLYQRHCSYCHGNLLEGNDESVSLSGDDFLGRWNEIPLSTLYDRIRKDMPMNNVGNLSPQVNADILAYMLSFNEFPAGKVELPPNSQAMQQIQIDYYKPEKK
jgi:cytochrome c